ncbi:conserved hypothetical protein [Candidatus Nitrotoga sp. BS]|nr:conserved hypothetical protein [Candidatus Nitrotoga sp. BS]
MMSVIKIMDRRSGVLLRPMNISSNRLLTYISSTEISTSKLNWGYSLVENLFCYLLSRLFTVRVIVIFLVFGKKRSGGMELLLLLIYKTVANSITRALCFRPSLIWQSLSQSSRSVICKSSPHYHSFE